MDTHDSEPRWYCLRSQPRRQNLAAVHLRSLEIEVFNPQLRLRRASRQGPVWHTTPLFPNYLFARFILQEAFRRARYSLGVSDVLRFGNRWADVPSSEIDRLKDRWCHQDALEVPDQIEVGDEVTLAGGLFHGASARVVALLPARQRVRVLLDFLGGVKEAEVDSAAVLPQVFHPLAV